MTSDQPKPTLSQSLLRGLPNPSVGTTANRFPGNPLLSLDVHSTGAKQMPWFRTFQFPQHLFPSLTSGSRVAGAAANTVLVNWIGMALSPRGQTCRSSSSILSISKPTDTTAATSLGTKSGLIRGKTGLGARLKGEHLSATRNARPCPRDYLSWRLHSPR